MKSPRIAAGLAAVLACSVGHATTFCTGSVSSMMVERTSGGTVLRVTLDGATTFVVDGKDDAWLRDAASFAGMSETTGQPVTAEFSESGLRCEGARGRTDLVSLTMDSKGKTNIATQAPRPDTAGPTTSERR